MLTCEAARKIASSYLKKINQSQVDYHPAYLAYLQRSDPTYMQEKTTLVLTDSREESFGWIFYYQSKNFLETNDVNYAAGGNAPIIVNKITGELWLTGTAHSIEYYVEQYEAKIGLG